MHGLGIPRWIVFRGKYPMYTQARRDDTFQTDWSWIRWSFVGMLYNNSPYCWPQSGRSTKYDGLVCSQRCYDQTGNLNLTSVATQASCTPSSTKPYAWWDEFQSGHG